MKKLFSILLIFILMIVNIPLKVDAAEDKINVVADSAVLMDAATGEILYSKNMDDAYPPASTTKTMTALLTFENCKLDDVVTTPKDFTSKNLALLDGNSIVLDNEEQIKVKDLLYALLLRSANDAAVALAVHISGSTEKFAELMNKRAAELGCTDTHFQNPNGLYDKDHKTSARDLALIMRELAKHPEYTQIATTATYNIEPTNKSDAKKSQLDRSLWNENKLANKNFKSYYYEGCDGGKTGYTVQSMHSYVATAVRNGQRLVVALVHSKDNGFNDARALFDYGFSHYELKTLFKKGDKVSEYKVGNTTIPLVASDNFFYVTEKNSKDSPQYNVNQQDITKKTFSKGDILLDTNVTMNGKKIGVLKLAAGISNESAIKSVNLNNPTTNKFNLPILILLGVIILLAVRIWLVAKRRKNKRKRIYNFQRRNS
ncbi:MAG: serine hydrolase [Bacillota bacterium]|nr:serine hydrolase [Bacillota bacterium]